jgi:cytochrome b6-f complex subunit 5
LASHSWCRRVAIGAGTMKELWTDRCNGLSMIEPLLCGIVLGLIPVTLAGLFVAAWNQYRRGTLLD